MALQAELDRQRYNDNKPQKMTETHWKLKVQILTHVITVSKKVYVQAYSDELGESLPVSIGAAVLSGELPGQVETVKAMGTQVADGRLDEGLAALRLGHHSNESRGVEGDNVNRFSGPESIDVQK